MAKLPPMFEWAAAGRATLGRCEFSRLAGLAPDGPVGEMPEDYWREFSSSEKLPPAARFDADEGMSLAQFAAFLQFQDSFQPGSTAKLLAYFDAQQQESVCSPRRSAVPPSPAVASPRQCVDWDVRCRACMLRAKAPSDRCLPLLPYLMRI